MAKERKPRHVPVSHAVDAARPRWCTCGRPSLERGAEGGPCPVLLAVAEGREPPTLGQDGLAVVSANPMPATVADEPLAVGERRASTHYGSAMGPTDPPPDSTWLIEEWTGTVWRRVAEVVGEPERDRRLHPR